ncbi:uncharacterized protein LOC129950777 [Eupeodes corollae]|uniref:uncharacterized protein LOC129950777 n=1 Tax=Eupeodes corollae TaxID=290404 RepID=UPI0024925B7A|nr:uncharacterized protein LOC129950777 [Eupeodes corollae]
MKNARQVRSNVKVLLTVFFDYSGIVHQKFLPQGRTVNKEYYPQYIVWNVVYIYKFYLFLYFIVAPVCRPGQRTMYSSGRHETVKVACEVEANPSEVVFSWKFNATATESVDIPASLVAIERGRSVAHYTPMTENDYGTLLCWSSNEIGDQSEPCVYTITPAGEPDPLINCTLLNQTSTGFQIECLEGFDGGLQQDFIMEVYVNGTTRHPRIYKSKTPFFEVRGLVPGAGYNVFLVAHNSKGRSNATILQVYTLKDPEKQTVVITFKKIPKDNAGENNDKNLSLAYAPVIEDIRPFLGILLGIVGSIFLVALIIVIIVRMRGSSGRDRNNYSHQVSRAGNLHNGPSIQDIRIGRETCQTSSVDSIDKNPDIIPQDGRDDEDEWTTTKGHSRAYATAALAEQNAIITSSTYDRIPTYAVIDKKTAQNHIQQQLQQHQQQQQQLQQQQQQQQASQQQHLHHHHGTPQYITTYNTLIPVSKIGYATQQQQQQQQQHPNQLQQHQQQVNKTDLTYAELAATGGQRIPYCSATLGRPRQSDIKRAEPNIYSQIDLAHHPMYSTSPMFGTNTITGVTMSHPSQLATFSTPTPIFASHKNGMNPGKVLTATTSSPAGSGGVFIGGGGVGGVGGPGSGMQSPVNSGSMLCLTTVGGGVAGMHQLQQQHQQQQHQQQQQQQHQPPSSVICTSIAPSSLVGISNGLHPVGVPSAGVAGCFGEANQSTLSILKTVPEELHHQIMTSDDLAKSKERNINHATRF